MNHTDSPWRYLCALDGNRKIDRELIAATRSEELNIVAHMAAGSKASILYAFSGNGKTSLIRAGLVPFFCEQGYAVIATRPRPPWDPDNPTRAFQECFTQNDVWLPTTLQEDLQLLDDFKIKLDQVASQDEHVQNLVDRVSAQLTQSLLAQIPGAVQETSRQPFLPVALKNQIDLVAEFKENLGKLALRDQDLRTLISRISARHARLSQSVAAQTAELKAQLKPYIGNTTLVQFLTQLQAFLGQETRVLIVCDQFEELFVHFYNTPEFRDFVTQIGQVYRADHLRTQFLFSMREDWVGSMVEFRSAIPDVFGSVYKLKPMHMKQAPPIFRIPLADEGITVTDEFITAVLDDLAAQYIQQQKENFAAARLLLPEDKDPFIELPALQVVLEELWKTKPQIPGKAFTLEHYRGLSPPEKAENAQMKSAAVA